MNVIKALIIKDFWEYKNNFWKIFITLLISFCFPLLAFNFVGVSTVIFTDFSTMTDIICVVSISLLYCETTLFQVHRNIRDGIYEKFFINANIKKYQIVFSKFLSNLILTIAIIVLVYISNSALGLFFVDQIKMFITVRFIVIIIIACGIGTILAFLNSLIIDDEKNAISYGGSFVLVYIGYFKLIEMLHVTSILLELAGLLIILLVLVIIVIYLLNHNRFIRRT